MKDHTQPEAPGTSSPGEVVPDGIRAVAEQAPVGMFAADAAGQWRYANPACLEIFGLPAEQVLGSGWLSRVHPGDRDAVVASCRVAPQGRGFHVEHRVCRPDGTVRTVLARKWPLPGPGGGAVGTITDVTEATAAQPPLRGTLQWLDRTGQVAGVGGWDIDLRTRAVRWSTQTYRIHERPPDWQPSIEAGLAHYAPEAQPVIAALVERAIRDGEPFDAELPFVTATGRRLRVRTVGDVEREGGVPVRLYGALQDVTAQRAAADALHASRERLRLLYEETPALLASLDMDGRLLSASRLLLQRLGHERAEAVGAPAFELLAGTPDDRRATLARVRAQLRRPQGLRALPVPLRHRDGSVVHTRMSAVIEGDADGLGGRLLAVFDDLSESLHRQAELLRERALRAELERQSTELARLADERRELLDVLTHEVRRPLSEASAALQSAASPGDDAAPRLARAQSVIGDVVAQIDNTLAAATLLVGNQALAWSDTDIDTLLTLVVADIGSAGRDRIELERHTATRTAAMDPTLMRLALRNLLANALRHAPPATPVTVRVADREEPPALVLEVADRGPGVPDALRGRLFERGARGPGSPGQGLGLYIVRRALQLHGGHAELLPATGGETVFRLVVPQGG